MRFEILDMRFEILDMRQHSDMRCDILDFRQRGHTISNLKSQISNLLRCVLMYSTILLLALGCKNSSKNSAGFTISGTITNPGSLKKIYLFQADSAGLTMVDSTNLGESGQFQFKRSTPYANLYDLRIGKSSIFDLIAKNGDDITFSTNLNDTAHNYKISGSDDSEKIKEFNRIGNSFNGQITKITEQYRAEAEKLGHESDSLISIYRPLLEKQLDAQSNAILKFADENK